MAEWLVEQGIGETRALLVERDEVRAARLRWPGELHRGQVVEAQLAAKASGAARGTAICPDGTEILLDGVPRDTAEGSNVRVVVTRASIAERGRYKRAQGRIAGAGSHEPCDLETARIVSRFPSGLWEEVWDTAWSGEVGFAGGSLLFAVTPGMSVVDVDGTLPPTKLALAAVEPLARALRQFDCGGSIGVDFPTLAAKADRKAVDSGLERALADFPHERTAMNGFGFVQIVARLDGPSLLHRMASSRVGAAARMALRRGELCEGTGRVLLLTVHPAVQAKLKPEWLAELARRSGREVRVESDPAIALGAGHAQMVGQ